MGNVVAITSLAASGASGSTGSDLKSKATAGFMAMHIVATAAHAVRNCTLESIPPVETDDPNLKAQMDKVIAGVTDLQGKLQTARNTADIWIGTLCATISSTIPSHILDYGATYAAASDQIVGLLDQAKGQNPPPGLIPQALDLIQALRGQVSSYTTEVESAKQQLSDYATKVQADHDALLGGNDAIQTLISIDSADIDALKSEVNNLNDEISAWNKQIMDAEIGVGLSIFVGIIALAVAPVSGGASLAVGAVAVGGLAASATVWGILQAKVDHARSEIATDQATETELQQQVLSLNALHGTVANVLNQIVTAQSALSDVGVFWQTFGNTLDGVITDLGKPNASLSAVIDEMWVNAAKGLWTDLTVFAQNLLDTTVVVQVKQSAAA